MSLFRICLIAAIILGLAVTGMNLAVVKDKINNLTNERDDQHKKFVDTDATLRKTKTELTKTKDELSSTKATLASTTDELKKTQTDLEAQTKRADNLTADLKKTTAERDDAQANLAAYVATGYKPPEIVALGKEFKALQTQLQEAALVNKAQVQQIARLTNELNIYKIADYVVPLPVTAKGKVLVTDPKWNFVVLDFGEDQGALANGELLVNRNGKLVAKVKISSVQKERCVANVVPGWQLGDVLEGDQVIPAHPQT